MNSFVVSLVVGMLCSHWEKSPFLRSRTWLLTGGTVFFDPLCTSATSPERGSFFTSWLFGFVLVFCRSTNFLSGNCQEVNVPMLKRRLEKRELKP